MGHKEARAAAGTRSTEPRLEHDPDGGEVEFVEYLTDRSEERNDYSL